MDTSPGIARESVEVVHLEQPLPPIPGQISASLPPIRRGSSALSDDVPSTPEIPTLHEHRARNHAHEPVPVEVNRLEVERSDGGDPGGIYRASISLARLSTPRHLVTYDSKMFTDRQSEEHEATELKVMLKAKFNRRGSVYRNPSDMALLDRDKLLTHAETMHHKMQTEIHATEAFTEVPLELVDDPMNRLITRARDKVDLMTTVKDVASLLLRINIWGLVVSCILFGILMYRSRVVFPIPRPSHRTAVTLVDILWPIDYTFLSWGIGSLSTGIMVASMFGWWRARPLFQYALPGLVVVYFAIWMILLGIASDGGFYNRALRPVPAFLMVLFNFYLVSHYVEKYQLIPHFRRKFFVPLLAIFVIIVLYFYVIPELYFSADSDLVRVAIRIFLHPLLFETAAYITRASVRNLRGNYPSSTYVMLLYVMAFNALYGRFLVSASSSTTWMVITSLILAAEEIFLRLSVGARDKLLYGLRHTPEEVRARFHTIRSVRLRADLLYIDAFLENTAIIMSSFTVWNFSVDGITFERAMQDMILQLSIEWATDIVVLTVEARHFNIPVYEAWMTRMWGIHPTNTMRKIMFMLPIATVMSCSYSYFISVYFDPVVGFIPRLEAREGR